ncbi:site-specific integrase [Roseomonas sp. M0104]|uniref:Site-specific integrase n=1 Tax=Teichococcus coralli TaxID=2545983 RepID=A0A845BIT0_9PROT|nr:tyrosine-type recombinase/integrase [Pseudoroseomonas coralli]MXP66076.1 site-specific integrase [Pseudoroseomonas coralli]
MKALDPRAVQAVPAELATRPDTPSFAAALAAVAGWSDLAETRRRDLASALSMAAKMLGLPSAAVPCDTAWLNARLFQRPAAAFGMGPRRFANIVGGLRAVLRRLGRHAPHRPSGADLSPAWAALLSYDLHAGQTGGLRAFARACTASGVAPDAVSDATLAAWAATERQTRLGQGAGRRAAIVARAWEDLRTRHGLDLPPLRAPARRQPYTFPFTHYPSSFQEDVQRFAARLAPRRGGDIYRTRSTAGAGRPRRGLREQTVKTRLFAIRQAAALLVRSGVPAEWLRSLRDLVEPLNHVERILDGIEARSGSTTGGQVNTVAVTLRIIAEHHVGLAGESLETIRRWAGETRPPAAQGPTGKVRERIRALVQPHAHARLLHLPEALMRRAREPGLASQEAARLARLAVALEILLICPLRQSNLRGLRLDRHLRRLDGRGRRLTHLVIGADEVKNHEPIEWPVPAASAALIETYIAQYRPLLAGEANPYLLPGTDDRPLSANGFAQQLKKVLLAEIGIAVHPHLMRNFAAWLYLRQHEGAYEDVSRILGHRSLDSARNFYILFDKEAVAARLDKVVFAARQETRVLARAARAGRPGAWRQGGPR